MINTSSSSPAINKLRCLPATSVINSPQSVAAVCVLRLAVEQFTARDGARYWLRNESNYFCCHI